MRAEPTVAPILPRYGESTLSDLATSLLASLGVPGEANPLGLPPAARTCLLVVAEQFPAEPVDHEQAGTGRRGQA